MDVSGKTYINAKRFGDFTSYSRSISFTDKNGEKHKLYESVYFRGGDPGIPSGSQINVVRGFEGGYMDKNGEPKRRLIVMEWEMLERGTGEHAPQREESPESLFQSLEEDVPF